MAELDERLSRLISDEDNMKRVLELASAVIAGQNGSSSQEKPSQNPPNQASGAATPPDSPDLTSVLGFLGANNSTTGQQNDSGSSSATTGLIELLPQLLQALSGNTSSLQGDRVNLIRAMQPYMSESRAGSIERAVRMANLTKVAKDFLKLMGR